MGFVFQLWFIPALVALVHYANCFPKCLRAGRRRLGRRLGRLGRRVSALPLLFGSKLHDCVSPLADKVRMQLHACKATHYGTALY